MLREYEAEMDFPRSGKYPTGIFHESGKWRRMTNLALRRPFATARKYCILLPPSHFPGETLRQVYISDKHHEITIVSCFRYSVYSILFLHVSYSIC